MLGYPKVLVCDAGASGPQPRLTAEAPGHSQRGFSGVEELEPRNVPQRPLKRESSEPTHSFPCDVFNGAALILADDSEEVTTAMERSACRRDDKPVHPSCCLFTRVSRPPIWKPLYLVRTITSRPPVSPSLP
ncbi:hypothetical protein NQZ68_006138 [Dissostichus eleginoides]|nr:hypothetical protein NQZ68_006138 [Dissostichus eleginoides]